MNAWNYYWLAWFIIVLVSFAIPEFFAIRDRKRRDDTLSESVWALLKTGFRVPFTILFIGTFMWLIAHFFWGY